MGNRLYSYTLTFSQNYRKVMKGNIFVFKILILSQDIYYMTILYKSLIKHVQFYNYDVKYMHYNSIFGKFLWIV